MDQSEHVTKLYVYSFTQNNFLHSHPTKIVKIGEFFVFLKKSKIPIQLTVKFLAKFSLKQIWQTFLSRFLLCFPNFHKAIFLNEKLSYTNLSYTSLIGISEKN